MVYHIPGRDRAGLTVCSHTLPFSRVSKESFIAVSAHQSESYYSTLFNQLNPLCNALNQCWFCGLNSPCRIRAVSILLLCACGIKSSRSSTSTRDCKRAFALSEARSCSLWACTGSLGPHWTPLDWRLVREHHEVNTKWLERAGTVNMALHLQLRLQLFLNCAAWQSCLAVGLHYRQIHFICTKTSLPALTHSKVSQCLTTVSSAWRLRCPKNWHKTGDWQNRSQKILTQRRPPLISR